jgi:hypothetical protein
MKDIVHSRPRTLYGEDIPLDPSLIVDWCMGRLQTWGTSVGMEMFKEEVSDSRIAVVLGGKVLVLDLDFAIDRLSDGPRPHLDVSRVQTSYAVPNPAGASNTEGSTSLNSFLERTIKSFLVEVQKPDDERDVLEAERFGKLILEQLKYLMMLDALAARKEDGGVKWFVDVGKMIMEVAKDEAESVAKCVHRSLNFITYAHERAAGHWVSLKRHWIYSFTVHMLSQSPTSPRHLSPS